VLEKDSKFLDYVKFFNPSELGIEVEEAFDTYQVKITKVKPGSPFEKADLKPGDIVLALAGKQVTSYETFRSFLRQELCAAGGVIVKVRRDDKEKEATVFEMK
jgi:S1-C subfamily serine protease